MLPGTSRYHEALSMDEESIRAYVTANGGKVPKSNPAPPLHAWSPEAALLATVIEELRAQRSVLIKINSKKGASIPQVEPVPRPESAWPKIEAELRLSKHASLVARLVPKREEQAPPQ
jgi:hypothetical protein